MKSDQPIGRCIRCRRRHRGQLDWAAQITEDRETMNGFLCPACMTPEEHAEVLMRRATGQGFTAYTGTDGRWWNKKPDPEPDGDDEWKARIARAAGLE